MKLTNQTLTSSAFFYLSVPPFDFFPLVFEFLRRVFDLLCLGDADWLDMTSSLFWFPLPDEEDARMAEKSEFMAFGVEFAPESVADPGEGPAADDGEPEVTYWYGDAGNLM